MGGENRFGYIAVFVVILGTVWYLSRCRIAVRCQRGSVSVGILARSLIGSGGSTAPALGLFGFRRQIGTELITGLVFHRYIGAGSCQQGQVPQAYRRGSCQQVERLQRQQYDASTGLGG